MCIFSRSLFVHLSFFFWPLCCLSLFELWLLISTLVSSNFCLFSFVHCIACPSATYSFWLPLWYVQTFAFFLFWPLYCSNYGFWLFVWYFHTFLLLLHIYISPKCTRYSIMWYSLSVTYHRSVVFSGYSGFLH